MVLCEYTCFLVVLLYVMQDNDIQNNRGSRNVEINFFAHVSEVKFDLIDFPCD